MSPHDNSRGRRADAPHEIPKAGWRDILLRVKKEIANDRVGFVSAGVAFYILLGLIPTLVAVISIYGFFADPADVESQLSRLTGILPSEAMDLLKGELKRVAEQDTAAGFGALIGIALALWGGSQAMRALIIAMNVAYDEEDGRGFLKQKILGLALTLAAALFAVVVVILLVALPMLLGLVGLESATETVINVLRWPAMFALAMVWFAFLYRYAPYRENAKWRWVTWGAFIATLLWMVGSALFSVYVANFGNYSKSYGSLGAIILLLLWFYLSAFALILGAEINSEMEHQTAKDSTTGPPKPRGQRGAYVADDVGKIP